MKSRPSRKTDDISRAVFRGVARVETVMQSVRKVRIHDANANSSGDYPDSVDRKRRVWSSANREREDGGVRVAVIREDVT